MRGIRSTVAVVAAACALLVGVVPASATDTIPASGRFSFVTANGILPTWQDDDITLVGISPGSVTTSAYGTNARVTVPIIAKTSTANAAAGGFRLVNTTTNESVRCANPTIDTRARVVDCVLANGTNKELFAITAIGSRARVLGSSSVTRIFRDVELRILDQTTADYLNESLSTAVFSPSVSVGAGDLVVTYDR